MADFEDYLGELYMEDEASPGEEPKEKDDAMDRLQSFVTRAAEQALLWRDEDLDPEQEKATDYYMGRPFGNEEQGRSRVVSTDVRDTVQAMLPSLMRIFFGSENVVEYEPQSPEDEPGAQQATDYINYVIRNDNKGFKTFHSVFKDALVRKIGIFKYWWEDKQVKKGTLHSGLTPEALQFLAANPEHEIEVLGQEQGPDGQPVYEVEVVRNFKDGRIRIAAVPPEEFIFSPDARSVEDAEIVGHVRSVPASELIAMGIDPDLVEEKKGRVDRTSSVYGKLESARRFDIHESDTESEEKDDAREDVWYGELYVYFDLDGDGIAELLMLQCVGDDYEIADYYVCDQRPFAVLCPDPEPHTLIGMSVADYVMDIQLIKSAMLRGAMDSLSLTLNPRTEIVEGEVNVNDIFNPEVGGIVRVTRPGMMREVATPFVGKEALPFVQYMDEVKENRTGISKAAAGLDADALQSATKAAVAATLSGAQQHIEMLARIFAETGVRDLYAGLLRLAVQHQQKERVVRLRNDWVQVDPASWNADMDVRINLALGAGSSEEKMQLLMLVAQEQKEQIMQGSPLVGLSEYRKTLSRMVELAGFPNSNEFFKPFGPQEEQQYEQQKAQQGQQDPNMKALEMQMQIEQAKLELDRQEMLMKDARERAKMELDFAIRQANVEAQYQTKIDNAEIQADVQAARAVMETDAKVREAKLKQEAAAAQAQQQAQAGPQGPPQPQAPGIGADGNPTGA